MTITGNAVFNHCEECIIEYVVGPDQSCPVCPLRVEHEQALDAIRMSEPFRILQRVDPSDMQESRNSLAAQGWTLAEFSVGHFRDHDHGRPLHVALLRRADYDSARHQADVDARLWAFSAEIAKRAEIEVETEAAHEDHLSKVWGGGDLCQR